MRMAYFTILSISGLLWGCATLKQKFSKKERQTVSLSRQEVLIDQSAAMERKERELMKYFGESATLMLKDGFRFHQDSGLVGSSALLHYRSQTMATEHQTDSTLAESLSEKYWKEDAQIKTEEVEKRKNKRISYWWLLLLVPIVWFIGRRRFL